MKETKAKRVQAHQRYKNKAGTVVPGVTTIVGSVLAKPALVPWANKLGLEGLNSKAVAERAAEIGTLAHHMIECDLNGKEPDLTESAPDIIEEASKAFESFLEWKSKHNLHTAHTELQLVSETYQYGGTIDWFGELDGVLTLVDFKTGSGLYLESEIQAAAYKQLLSEYACQVEEIRIVRFGRGEKEYEEKVFKDLDKQFEIFFHLNEIYMLKEHLKKGVK